LKNKSTINLYDERRNPLGLGLRIYRSLIGLSMIIQGFKFASRYKKKLQNLGNDAITLQ